MDDKTIVNTRRSHTKSRRGCFTCKSRKVKCPENRPECANCTSRGITCVYPDISIRIVHRKTTKMPQSHVCQNEIVRSPSAAMNKTDLRLLHHFLLYATPHIPPGNSQVWTHQVPAQAHEYEVIMHAMLGLAATHLAACDGDIPLSIGLVHRQHAIQGIKDLLARHESPDHMCELEAVLAASYALAQQATYLDDGFADVLPLYRGCQAIYSTALMQESVKCGRLFQPEDSSGDELSAKISESGLNKIDPRVLIAAEASLMAFQSLCQDHPTFSTFHQLLVKVVQNFRENASVGFASIAEKWEFIMLLPDSEIRVLLESTEPASALLQAHWLAILLILDRLRISEFAARAQWVPIDKLASWILDVCKPLHTDREHKEMLRWPMQVARAALEQRGRKKYLAASTLWKLIEKDPELFC